MQIRCAFQKNTLLVIILIGALLSTSCRRKHQLPVKFYREDVSIWVEEGEVTVQGIYYFKNRTDYRRKFSLLFPFPVDSLHMYPYEIEVIDTDFKKSKKGITFDIIIDTEGTVSSEITYKQKLLTKSARYILSTARVWLEPIERAGFVVSLPEDFENYSVSYKPDSIVHKNDRIFYYFEKENLLPDKDIEIIWE